MKRRRHDDKTARYAAIEALRRLARTKLPMSKLFEQVAQECRLGPNDRQLAKKISYGVLRQRHYLDSLLTDLCRRPITKIKPFVYHALLTGLFQLFFLNRIPPSAAVNETVKAVQTAHFPKQIQGFVNGVLRESLRRKDDLPGPYDADHFQNPFLNHPDWLTIRWRNHYGTEAMKQICATNNVEPILCLRVTQQIDKESLMALFKDHNIMSLPGTFAPDALLIPDIHGPITALPGFNENFFQVQGQAAQLTSLLLGPFCHGGTYLDCCAGLGGKTSHLASLIKKANGSLTAIEPDGDRFAKLRQNLQHRSEAKIITIRNETIEHFAKVCTVHFNAILVDAPCSGTGVICRHPDIRWNRIEQDLISYQLRQIQILNQAAPLVLPGGVLVYATCSIEPEENSSVIRQFLDDNRNFLLENCSDYLPASARNFVSHGCFAPLPTSEIDGFFAARLRRSA